MDRRRLSACANFLGYTDAMGYINQPNTEQRRLSDGPSLRLPNYNFHYPGEFGGSETCMLKQKNSSLTMLLDSTNSIMRTASTTFQNLFCSPRRASFCGEPDPTIQLSPNGNIGSLYLLPTTNSNDSSLSNLSTDEQRRTVTIYDGRIPSTTTAPTIPFELMTPIDAITQAVDDPVESFVQIVLEEPNDKPPIIPSLTSSSSSSSRRNSPSRHRHRNSSPHSLLVNKQREMSDKQVADSKSLSTTDIFNSSETYCQPPEVIQPMDFSFLEPVLRGESAAPPPTRSQNTRPISSQNNSNTNDSSNDIRHPIHPIMITTDDSTYLIDPSTDNNNKRILPTRLKVPSSID